jgi:hypothetical protein
MVESQTSIQNFADIRDYVTQTLSQFERLRPESSHLTTRLLTRNNQPCGIYFCLHGPRAVKLTAIWETDANSILFYSSRGERVQRTRLLAAPDLDIQALQAAA